MIPGYLVGWEAVECLELVLLAPQLGSVWGLRRVKKEEGQVQVS